MKPGIHPEYETAQITCACGRVTETRTTVGEIHVEICSHCHPFFTGRQKLVDTAGRVERFKAKYGDTSVRARAAKRPPAEPVPEPAEETATDEETPAAEAAETPAAEAAESAGADEAPDAAADGAEEQNADEEETTA